MVRRLQGWVDARTSLRHTAPPRRQRAANQLEDHAVTLGPLEYTVIGFQGKQELDGSIAHELEKVVANGTIRIVDLVFIARDDQDNAVAVELDAKSDPKFASFAPLISGSLAPSHRRTSSRSPRHFRTTPPRSWCCSSTAGRSSSRRRSAPRAASSSVARRSRRRFSRSSRKSSPRRNTPRSRPDQSTRRRSTH